LAVRAVPAAWCARPCAGHRAPGPSERRHRRYPVLPTTGGAPEPLPGPCATPSVARRVVPSHGSAQRERAAHDAEQELAYLAALQHDDEQPREPRRRGSGATFAYMTTKGQEVRAAIYVRASRDSREDRASVTRQLEACQALAESRGYTVAHTFEDNDISAASKGGRV